MADFVARIRAELDTSGVLSQLKNLTSTERTLPIKIELDTSSLNNAMRNLGGGSGGLVQNFGNLGKQAGSAFADNYFKEQIQLAKRANQLKDQFPDSKKLSKADSFYKSAAKAELTEQKRTQKETQKVLDQQYDYLGKRERQYNTERAKAIAKNQSDIRKMEREQAQETQKALDQQYNYLGKRESEYQTERAKAIAKNQADIRRMEREQAQEASAYSKQFGNGKYSADSAVMDNKLSQYAGQDSEALSRARAAAEEYKTIMDELNQSFDQNKGFNLDDSMVVDKFSKMEDAAEKYKNAMKQVGAESTKSLGKFEATTESNKILKYFSDNSKAAKKYGDQLQDLAERMRNATTVGEKQGILAEFNNVKSAISAEGLTGRSIFDEIGRGFKQIGQFVGTYRLIMESIKTIKQMVNEVTVVDSALIELRKVSNASDAEISKSFEAATESAKKYGVAISDVVNSQADWARLGYGVKEAQQLADVTTLFQTVGDNMTQQTASESLISILKGYQMDVSQAESIVDKLNQVARHNWLNLQ